jgi:hypothetical protein
MLRRLVLAYDMRADHASTRWESNISMADRQACLDRVRAVEKNASEIRKSKEASR